MKKIIALIIAGMMAFGMVACGGTETEETQADTTAKVEITESNSDEITISESEEITTNE